MADIIKKAIIQQENLPRVGVDLEQEQTQYLVRYRLTSEDGSQFSAWSNTWAVKDGSTSKIITSEIINSISSDGVGITTSWNAPEGLTKPGYDTYVRWSTTPFTKTSTDIAWTYFSTTKANTFYISVPDGMKYVQTRVQLDSYPKAVNNISKLFTSAVIETRAILDGGAP